VVQNANLHTFCTCESNITERSIVIPIVSEWYDAASHVLIGQRRRRCSVSLDDVTAFIKRLSDKQSFCDMLPVLKQAEVEVMPFFVRLHWVL